VVDDAPGVMARGLCGLNNDAATTQPLTGATGCWRRLIPDGTVGRLVVMCPEESLFFFFFLQGRTCMRASGLPSDRSSARGLDPGSATLVSREIQN
jgi:hypothetical protein